MLRYERMKSTTFDINIPVSIFKEGRQFIAYTPVLDVSTCGGTAASAKKRFEEAVGIFFEECTARGTLADALTSLGWKKLNRQWQPPKLVSQLEKRVRVPAFA